MPLRRKPCDFQEQAHSISLWPLSFGTNCIINVLLLDFILIVLLRVFGTRTSCYAAHRLALNKNKSKSIVRLKKKVPEKTQDIISHCFHLWIKSLLIAVKTWLQLGPRDTGTGKTNPFPLSIQPNLTLSLLQRWNFFKMTTERSI